MGKLPLQRPDWSQPQVADWKKLPGMLELRLTFLDADRRLLSDGTLDWFWPEAERHQIALMLHAQSAKGSF